MEKVYTGRQSFLKKLAPFVFQVLFFVIPLLSFSQVVVTETEEEMGIGQEPNQPVPVVVYSDSAKALIKAYQQHYLQAHPYNVVFPYTNVQPLVTECPNSDFSSGTFANWWGAWGTWPAVNPKWYTNEFDTNTIPPWPHSNAQCYNGSNPASCPPLHSIIPAPGTWDPNTGDSLISVFPGETFSSRLGHNVGGTHRSQLKYTVFVDSTTYLFVYRFSVVLQNPSHGAAQQPSFTIQVLDSTGVLIDSCGYYYFCSPTLVNSQLPPTWHKHGPAATRVIWKEWTTVGMSLVSYFGQRVSITFESKDCQPGGHFGYAYLSAYCSYITLQTAMCEGDSSATLTAPPGFTYLWNTGDTTQSITVPHPVTGDSYSCTLTALNGCQVTITQVLTYTVIHTNFTHETACAGLGTQFHDSSTVSQNSVFNWIWDFGDASPKVTGVKDPVHIYATSGDYNVTLKSFSTEGCADSITKSVHVDSLPHITNTILRERICNNTNTNIIPTSDVTSTVYTWTATASSLSISGYSNSITPGLTINQTLINTGNKLDSVSYDVFPDRNLCIGPDKNFVVTVCPVPNLTNISLSEAICDSTNTNISLTSNVDSTKFTWTATANPGNNLSGFSSNLILPGTLNINQLLYNSGYNVDTVHYTLTGHAYGCDGPSRTYNVIVYPLPDLSNSPLSKNICSGDNTAIPLTSHVAGTQFTWTCTASGPGITGWSNNVTPASFLNQQLFNSNTVNGTVTYHITPHANNCDGHVYHYLVTVKPIPTVTNTVNPSICSGNTTNIILTSNMAGTTFSWTASGSSFSVSGFSNSSGPIIAQTLINTGFNLETVTYVVTPLNNGCPGSSHNIVVTVFPVADVYFTPSGQTLCSGLTTNLILASHVAGATFSWWGSGSSGNVSGYSASIGNTIAQTLINSWIYKETVTYYALPTANGCPGTQGDADVFVDPVPVVTFTQCYDPVTTTAAMPIKLHGGIPLQGIYSGPGVSGGVFTPSAAGTGVKIITYLYSNTYGCSRTATQTITVVNPASFLCGDNLTDVRDNKVYPTVKQGSHCWMATNLNYGVKIPYGFMQRDNCISEKYCYNDNLVNCTTYGGLYQWDELMVYDNSSDLHGLCPPGWHVPTENEWNSLFAVYLNNGFAGAAIKYTGYAGFNAFLSSMWFNNISWDFFNFAVMFWSSTEHAPLKAWAHGMNNPDPSVSYYPSSKTHAFSVRCIQD